MKLESSLVFDIGTSSVKAGLFFYSDKKPLLERVALPSSEAFTGGWPVEYWHSAIRTATGRLLSRCPEALLSAVVVSGNGPSVVAVGDEGLPVGDALLWTRLDAGFRSGGSYFLDLFRLLARSLSSGLEGVAHLLPCPEYITYRLCGEAAAFIPNDTIKPLYWEDGDPSFDFCRGLLPPFVHCGERMGSVTAGGAELLGVPVGVPVYAGGTDYVTAMIGSGAVSPGVLCDRAGTSEGLNLCVESDGLFSDELNCSPHPIAPYSNLSVILSSSGPLFEWYRRSFGLEQRSYNEMIAEIRTLAPELTPIFFPSLVSGGGREFHSGCFAGLHPESGAMEMGRGVLQAIGFEVASVFDRMAASRTGISRVVVCGGQAKSDEWNRMKADMTGRLLMRPEVVDAELTGCHCLAAVGSGRYRDIAEAVAAEVKGFREYEPDLAANRRYRELAGDYFRLNRKASELVSAL